ncbi:MAG TPA: acyl carrier protein [Solirubrobacterales bacterium]|nr:acyl carrier protein [Solirubrobacterales bacterium]
MTKEVGMDRGNEIEAFIVEKITQGEKIAHDEDLLASGVLDSLAIAELVSFLESRFQIRVSDDDLMPENFKTIDEIAAFVNAKGG